MAEFWQNDPVVQASGGNFWSNDEVVSAPQQSEYNPLNLPIPGTEFNPQEPQWRRGTLAPVEKNLSTGELRPAIPQVLHDIWGGVTLPGDVARGEVQDFNPGQRMSQMSDDASRRVMGLSGVVTPPALRGVNPSQIAVQQMTRPQTAAIRNITRALSDDQIPINQVQSQIERLGPAGRLMDVGPNTQQLAGGAVALPGGARKTLINAIEQRTLDAGPRIRQAVRQAFGTGQPRVVIMDDMVKAQQAAAAPLYKALDGVFVNPTGNIKFVLDTQFGKTALNSAKAMAQAEGVEFVNSQGQMTVRALDLVKQSLDDMATSAMRGSDPKPNQARVIGDLARRLRNAVDEQVPGYKEARSVFAGHAALQDAMEVGTNIFKRDVDPTTFRRSFDAMTASEREAMLNGARVAIEDTIGNAVNDPLTVRNILRRGYNRDKLETLLGREKVDDLIASIQREMTFGQTANVVAQNSQTAQRMAAMGDLDPASIKAPQNVTILGLIKNAFDAVINKTRSSSIRKSNEAMAQMMADPRYNSAVLQPNLQTQASTILPPLSRAVGVPALMAQPSETMGQMRIKGLN